ncbi:MAG: glycosyltransferase family 4 protein [Methanobacteriota archaeon]|nr:MAG: glycosyltransferase family 4 protein [Euryarchaeota archaeon]
MTRILFLAADIDLSRNRGDTLHARNLARALVRVGNEVHMVVGASPSAEPIDGVNVSVRPDRGDARIVRFLLRKVRDVRPDIIYERRFSPKLASALSVLTGLPFAVEINGIPGMEAAMQGRPGPSGLSARVRRTAHTRFLRSAASIVAVTPGLRNALVTAYGVDPSRAFVVPNGVDAEMFRPEDRTAARRDLSLSDGKIVCFVGNLVRWQGLDLFMAAMEQTPGSLSAVLVGDGPDHARLVELARSRGLGHRVRFMGEVPYSTVPRYLAAADACVAPFTAERNLPLGVSALKVLEYLASARPIVVTAIPGARDLVDELGCGLVVPPEDPAALGEAMVEVVSNEAFAGAALRASEIVRERYSWDRTAQMVTDILRRSLN